MAKSADIDPLLVGGTPSQPHHTLGPENSSSYLGKLWAQTRDEVRHDFKSTRWRHTAVSFFKWLGFSIWALGLVVLCLIFPLVITYTISLESSDYWNYCAPDGSFSLEPSSFWNPDWAFQIVLAFGSLSFTQAKVVDIVWDIGVGRIGQSLLAYFSWRAFSVYVRASMETTPVTYRTYWTIFMQNHASVQSIFRLVRDFTTKRGLRSKVAMVFMILTMVFVMAFPTLASAMTGYTANNEAVIKFGNGTQTPFENFNQIVAIIHDGGRVNLTDEYMVFKGSQPNQHQTCGASNCIDAYISLYGILKDTDSLWGQRYPGNDIPVKSPTLNITYSDGKGLNTTFFYLPRNNNSYSLGYVQENAVCQPVMANHQQTYQWGFSVIQLETTLILLTLWTFGVWLMWLHAHHELSNRGRYEAPKDLKAALYLADAIRADLKDFEQQADFMTNKELEKSADEHLKGGRVEVLALTLDQGISCRKSSWRWVKTNKLWLFMFIFALGTCMYFLGNILAILAMSFAMAAGWGRKTRAIVSWAAWLVGMGIYLPILLRSIGMR
ncbi:hypothetical protein KVR01_012436 [Diaporthe batatas]|uniref:uncharacterized protein n=1 Tax=Diaporthe batatas TaxID=748121 RepID=UPI001D05A319|nr:uncharacterized protein KVR01_012436 [Diaporthe batatas]KAG8157774.1 hypothetical protein KVR01_012436 [Diaporthe batatas]